MQGIQRLTLATLAGLSLTAAAACKKDNPAAPKVESYSASLSGSNETTPPALVLGATGTSTMTVNGNNVTWTITTNNFAGGTTAPGSASTTLPAHIHLGAVGVAGGIMVPLSAVVNGSTTGTATVADSVLTHMRAGNAYVNVHTAARAAGEIRGQLVRNP